MAKNFFSRTPALDSKLIPKIVGNSPPNIDPIENNLNVNTSKGSIKSNLTCAKCTLVAGDTTINVCSDKCVNVFVTENISEQKYIKNVVTDSGSLCVGSVDAGNVYTNVVSNVQKLAFDDDSGFAVCNLGNGTAKIAMNSTFKYWEVDGNPGLTACGLDTVNFIAGSGITITSNNSAVPKSLTISATGGGGGGVSSLNGLTGAVTLSAGNNVSIGASGNTLTICSASGSPTLDSRCNLAIGGGLALAFNGCNNLAIGYKASYCTTGSNNIAIGCKALYCNLDGIGNIAQGYGALYCSKFASGNIALGFCSAYSLRGGGANTAMGNYAMGNAGAAGNNNVALGDHALYCNAGDNNIALGCSALYNNFYGCQNIALGFATLVNNTYGKNNIALGHRALRNNIYGNHNIALGYGSLSNTTTSCNNISIGNQAGDSITTGVNNTIIGSLSGSAGLVCTVLIGAGTCERIRIDSTNTYIGNAVGISSGVNNTLIGCGATGATITSNNTITLGNSAVSCIRAQVTTISALSDQRDKTNVQDLPLGLQFILDLRPVKFTWNMRDGAKIGIDDTGFIAQEVLSVEDKYDVSAYLDMVGRENSDKLEIKPGKLIPILVKAIQELYTELSQVKSELQIVKQQITGL